MGQSIANEDKVGKETETFSVGQAADFLQTHPETLKARARTGEIKGDKPGLRWVFLEEDLIACLKSTQPVSSQSHELRLTSPETSPVPEDESPAAKRIAEERLRLRREEKRRY